MNRVLELHAEEAGTSPDRMSTRVKLILTAEKLFATRGIEAVSLREIAAAAGQRNTNAVTYHFKSKLGLAWGIFTLRMEEMEEPRRQLLAEVEKRGLLGDTRALLEAFCLPQLNVLDDEGCHSYAGFMAHYQYHQLPEPSFLDESKWPTLHRIYHLLLKRIDYVPFDAARLRIRISVLMFQDLLARLDQSTVASKLPFPIMMSDRLEAMTAALCAPYQPNQDARHQSNILQSLKLSFPKA